MATTIYPLDPKSTPCSSWVRSPSWLLALNGCVDWLARRYCGASAAVPLGMGEPAVAAHHSTLRQMRENVISLSPSRLNLATRCAVHDSRCCHWNRASRTATGLVRCANGQPDSRGFGQDNHSSHAERLPTEPGYIRDDEFCWSVCTSCGLRPIASEFVGSYITSQWRPEPDSAIRNPSTESAPRRASSDCRREQYGRSTSSTITTRIHLSGSTHQCGPRHPECASIPEFRTASWLSEAGPIVFQHGANGPNPRSERSTRLLHPVEKLNFRPVT